MRERVVTGLLGVVIVLGVLLAPTDLPLLILAAAAAVLGSYELAKLAGNEAYKWAIAVIALATFLLDPIVVRLPLAQGVGLLAAMWVVGAGAVWALARGRRSLDLTALAAFWLAAPLLAARVTAQLQAPTDSWHSRGLLLFFLVPLWAGDTAALFVGKAIGKHPLAPKISPKKTWEGAIANLFACLLFGFITSYAVQVPWGAGLACGACCGVFGQLGDLLESALKRQAEVKDSGALLPGHGGVLDRIDSFLFSAVPVAIALWFLAPTALRLR